MSDQDEKENRNNLSQQDPTVMLYDKKCEPDKCHMVYCDTNSYGVMYKCTW
jgi:hypothetical protein